jgi:hypothetical protein
MFLKILALSILLIGTVSAQAVVNVSKLGSAEQQKAALEHNKRFSAEQMMSVAKPNWNVDRPFSEIEQTGFVAISGEDTLELPELREAIAKNLPDGVTLVVYVSSQSEAKRLKPRYDKYLNPDQLKFLVVPMGGYWSNPIWGRDSLPFPVYLKDGKIGLVDSGYPQDFEPDQAFKRALGLPMTSSGYVFRGGNLLLDLDANCWLENANEIVGVDDPDRFLQENFGCKTVTLLRQDGGIGDIDERIKFLEGREALTDSTGYAKILRDSGYNVRMIPRMNAKYRTYMNTLLVNNTIFVPQMGVSSDQDALDAYKSYGFNPVGVYTRGLADEGHGNIHCTTMNYPPGTFIQSKRGYDFVEFDR